MLSTGGHAWLPGGAVRGCGEHVWLQGGHAWLWDMKRYGQ